MSPCRLSTGHGTSQGFIRSIEMSLDASRTSRVRAGRNGGIFRQLKIPLETSRSPRRMPEMQYFHELPGVVDAIVNHDGTMH